MILEYYLQKLPESWLKEFKLNWRRKVDIANIDCEAH